MRWIAALMLVAVVTGSAQAQPALQPPVPSGESSESSVQQKHPDQTQQHTTPDQRGTPELPLSVKVLPPIEVEIKPKNAEENQLKKALNDWGIPIFTGVSTLIFLAQLIVFGRQARRLKETVDAMKAIDEGQSAKVMESIAQATRAATAMEGVAVSMAINAAQIVESVATSKEIAARQKVLGEMQLRAYLSVVIGGGFYQDRAKGNYFQGTAALVNQGHTPATKVVHRTCAAILPVPLPVGFVLPALPEEGAGESMMGPQQNRVLSSAFVDFCADDEVEDIKQGLGKGLYFWGEVTYEDAFGQDRVTTFCHLLTWRADGKSWGYYTSHPNH